MTRDELPTLPRGRARKTAVVLALVALAGALACGSPVAETSAQPPDSPTFSPAEVEGAVRALLEAQVADWNAHDIDAFMEGYWNSPELRFVSGASVRRGWQETLERYRTTYPDAAAMGELEFDVREIDVLAPDAALVLGAWRLHREGDSPNGLFTLIFRRIDGSWKIVHDHTSSASE